MFRNKIALENLSTAHVNLFSSILAGLFGNKYSFFLERMSCLLSILQRVLDLLASLNLGSLRVALANGRVFDAFQISVAFKDDLHLYFTNSSNIYSGLKIF